MKRVLWLLALSSALAGCTQDTGGPNGQTAELRLLHASPATGAVDVLIDNTSVIQNVAFGHASALVMVPAGSQTIVVRSGSQVIAQLTAVLATDHLNSLVVASGSAALSTAVTDTGAVNPARANVRLVNIVGPSTAEPNLIDAKLRATNQQGQAPDSVQTFGIDARVASYGSLMYLTPGDVTVTFVPRGGTTVLAQVVFAAPAGEKKAVTLERTADGSYHAQVVTEP